MFSFLKKQKAVALKTGNLPAKAISIGLFL